MNGASFLQYSLTLEDADQHYDDQSGYADADEDVNVFQRDLAEILIEILKGVQLTAVGAGIGFLFASREVVFSSPIGYFFARYLRRSRATAMTMTRPCAM